jgi:hypothetical protein
MYLFTAKAQRTQRFNYFLFSAERPENKKNQLYKVYLIARATIFVTYLKPQLFSEKVLFYSLPSSLPRHSCQVTAGQRQRIRKNISASFAPLR